LLVALIDALWLEGARVALASSMPEMNPFLFPIKEAREIVHLERLLLSTNLKGAQRESTKSNGRTSAVTAITWAEKRGLIDEDEVASEDKRLSRHGALLLL